jgi:TP901 family phage tail tape measure protein
MSLGLAVVGQRIDTLFYEIDAHTSGFEENMKSAKAKLSEFTAYAAGHPALILAALGAAFVAVGVHAAEMAGEIDASMRQIKAQMPGAASGIAGLRSEIEALSLATPKSQKELAATAVEIAKLGVASTEELGQRLRAVAELSEASSIDMKTVAEGLNTLGDAFGLSGHKAVDAMKLIFATAQGKVPLDEVFTSLQRGASVLSSLGVKATEAATAMATLRDAGVMSRKVGTSLLNIVENVDPASKMIPTEQDPQRRADLEKYISIVSQGNIAHKGFINVIKELSEAFGNNEFALRRLGLSYDGVNAVLKIHTKVLSDSRTEAEKLADAEKAVENAATENRGSLTALNEKVHNELDATMIRFGNHTLPLVTSALRAMIDTLDPAGQKARELGEALDRIQAGKNNQMGATESAISNVMSYVPGKGSAATSDIGKMAQGFEEHGADLFAGRSAKELEQMFNTVQKYGDASVSVDKLKFAINDLIIVRRKAEKDEDDAAAAEKKRTQDQADADDVARKKLMTDAENRRIRRETEANIAGIGTQLRQALSAETTTQIDNATASLNHFRQEIEQLQEKKGDVTELQALYKKAADVNTGILATVELKERTEAAKTLAEEMAKSLGIQSTSMQVALDTMVEHMLKLNDEYAKLGKTPLFPPERIQEVVALREALIGVQETSEAIDHMLLEQAVRQSSLTPIGKSSTDKDRNTQVLGNIGDIMEANIALDSIKAKIAALPKDPQHDAERKALLEQQEKIQTRINALRSADSAILANGNEQLMLRLKLLNDQAGAIGSAIDMATQLAGAFGLGNSNILSMVSSVGKAVAGVKPFMAALDVFKSGKKDEAGNPLMSLGGLLGSAMPMVGGVVAAVGFLKGLSSDPKVEAARAQQAEAMKTLTTALYALRDTYLQNVSNKDVQTDIANAKRIIAGMGIGTDVLDYGQTTFNGKRVLGAGVGQGAGRRGTLRDIGSAIGQDFDSGGLLAYFVAMDKKYGTNLASFVKNEDPAGLLEAIKKLPDALQKELGKLGGYADNVADTISKVNFQFDLLGKTDAVEKFRAIIAALKQVSGIDFGDFKDTFDKLADPATTAEERQKIIEDAVTKLTSGGAVNFGSLTPDQLRALLKEASSAFGGATGPLGTGGFNVSQTITQVTGERMQALLVTGNTFLEQIANNTSILAGTGGIVPPAVTPSGAGGGAGDTYNVTVSLEGAIIGAGDPVGIGDRLGQAFVTRINKSLGREAKIRALTTGQTLKA